MTKTDENNKKLDDVLIDVSRDLWPSLANIITISALIYFSVKPEAFIVTAMGIFHLPPQLLLDFYSIAMPLIVAASLSRFLLILWKAVLPYPIALFLIVIFFPLIMLDRYVLKRNWVEKLLDFFEKKKKSPKKPQKTRKFLLSNIILFCTFSMLFFACYLGNNSISRMWLPSKNPYMVIIAYNHYYCQISGNYNESECKYWKK